MRKARKIAAVLLALILIVFGANFFLELFELPPPRDEHPGDQLLLAMRNGGLMAWVSLSHVLVGALLLLPRARFLGALLQAPISLGILAFHASMQPEGLGPAVVMLALNGLVLWEPARWREVLACGN